MGEAGAIGAFGICLAICILGPLLAVPIAALVIASQYEQTCFEGSASEAALIELPKWLTIYGSVSIIVVLVFFLAIGLAAGLALCDIGDGIGSMATMIVGAIIMGCYSIFNVIWNVIGAVALFRDSMPCQTEAKPLWAMVLAVLIFQWVGIVQMCCVGRLRKSQS